MYMNKISIRFSAIATLSIMLSALAPRAVGHHAFAAEFDANQPITLEGRITRIEWINPHAWFHVEVAGEDGEPEDWRIEAGSPNTLVRRGLNRDTIPVGTEVVVFGFRHRNGTNAANGRNITLPDGSQLLMSSPGTGAPE